MYRKIDEHKQQGLKKSQVARKLGINVKTVSKYWGMELEEYEGCILAGTRTSKLDPYHPAILAWLKEYPDLSSAQVLDWIKERYNDLTQSERNVRRFVALLRKEHGIEKKASPRDYQAVPELPVGQQMQVDFGEIRVKKVSGGTIKLYVMAAVLAHSRYKCGIWSDKPLTTTTFLEMLERCLREIGIPRELVFDQDRLLAVSENFGDIIYTADFERFRRTMGFSVHLCRANDPESKGKVEAVVKYVKNNFARHRVYSNLLVWNEEFEAWLGRTANAREHGIIKRVPAECFLTEKLSLRPVPHTNTCDVSVARTIRKDNTVIYKGNRYSLPLGTYRPGREVDTAEADGKLKLFLGGEVIATHQINSSRGQLIQNTNHMRDHSASIDTLLKRVVELLDNSPGVAQFLTAVRHGKPRYIRDQLGLLERVIKNNSKDIVLRAITYCSERQLYSTTDCRDTVEYLTTKLEPLMDASMELPVEYRVKTEVRSITAYASLLRGVANE